MGRRSGKWWAGRNVIGAHHDDDDEKKRHQRGGTDEMQQHDHDDDDDLRREFARPDLCAIGTVLVRRGGDNGHQQQQETSSTVVWSRPDCTPLRPVDPETLDAAKYEPVALLLVFAQEARAYLRPEWRRVPWVTRQVEALMRQIQATRGGVVSCGVQGTAVASRSARSSVARRN
jgi:hypothetical protein